MKKVQRSYKYRIYPNAKQAKKLQRTFGCVRFVWNKNVELFNITRLDCTCPLLIKRYLGTTKLKEQYTFLGDVSASALQQKHRDWLEFQKQFFSKSRKKRLGRPRFKKKSDKQSYRLPNQKFKLLADKIHLEKIGKVRCVIDRRPREEAKFLSVTVSYKNGQYFASVLVEEVVASKPKVSKTVGFDVGLKSFCVDSDAKVIANPRYRRDTQAKIARIQLWQSKKRKGSTRWLKLQRRLWRLWNKVNNRKAYFLHSVANYYVENYDHIVVEDLNVSGMMKNHRLAGAIQDASWSELFRIIGYKSNWFDRRFTRADRFEPTSKTCSDCGWLNHDLTMEDRVFVCSNCGSVKDRDYNAACNIKSFGVKNDSNRTLRIEVTKSCEAPRIIQKNLPLGIFHNDL